MDKTGALAVVVGKRSFSNEQLQENTLAALTAVSNAKPDGFKGKFVRSLHVSSTMSPSVKITTSVIN
jgi:large subunit ribosomal protein L1